MFNVLLAFLTVIGTSLLTALLLSVYVKRTLPIVLEDVAISAGESISNQLKEAFTEPNVKKAFTILGKQSGVARADDALRNKAADKLLEGVPSIGFILDQLDITPVEGLALLRDPLIGPFIQGFLQKGAKGLFGGLNPGQSEGGM